MKKGFKKMKVNLSTAKNYEMLGRAIGEIDRLTKSGSSGMKYTGCWNGMNYSEAEFFANLDEVKKVKTEIEKEFGVTISFKK